MKDTSFKLTALSAGVAIALGSIPLAQAQQDEKVEEIVVTGSHIRRTEFEGRAPIQIVDQADFELIGAVQPVDMLKQLTANSGSQFYNETNDRAGVSQVNIRGLGLGSTLTLINGKRAGIAAVADDTGTDFVDINQYPLAMIERIEVLTDGASALYGSQAVAGVANIITRKGFEGLEVSAGYADAEIDAWNVNFAAGTGFDQGNFNVYATYYNQGHKERSEFDWMQDRLIGQGDISRSRFLSSTGSPGTYLRSVIDPATNEASPVSGADRFPDPDCEAAGGVFLNPADIGGADTSCRYHFVDQVSVISAERRAQVFTEFDWNFNDTVRYYFEGNFSNNVILRDNGGATLNTGRAEGGGFTITPDHPFNFFIEDPNNPEALVYIGPDNWDDNVYTAATLKAIARPFGADVNNNEYTTQIRRELNYFRALNGFEVQLPADWYLDVSYMWSKSQRTTDDTHTYRSDIFQDQVRSGEWNPFGTRLSNPTLVTPKQRCTTPGQLNCTNFPGATAGTDPIAQAKWDQSGVSTARVESKVFDLMASGQLFETSWGSVGGAVGYQYRDNHYVNVPDSLGGASEANEQGLSFGIDGKQDVSAFYAEVVMPIADMAEIQLAVRNEDYGSGVSTTDPKVGFEFSATDWLAFRGSWGTSFQAPTIRQTASASSSAFIDDPASPTGPNGSLVCVSAGLNNNITVSVQGAPDLKPQESENFNLGAVFTSEQFRASIDYFSFDYTQLIAQSEGAQAIVDNDCAGDGIPNDPRVIRDAGGQLRQVNTEFVNIGSVKTDGIDIKADYTMDVANTQLIFDMAATYVNTFDVDANGDGTKDFDGAGSRNFRNSFSTMPQWRGLLGGTWLFGNQSANLTMRYIDGYKNDQSNDAPVDSYTTWDAQYSIVLPELVGGGDTVVTLGINNLLDEDPPALTRANSDGSIVTRYNSDGTYNTGWIDRPGYDDRAGVDLRGRILYLRFKQSF